MVVCDRYWSDGDGEELRTATSEVATAPSQRSLHSEVPRPTRFAITDTPVMAISGQALDRVLDS